MRWLSFGRDHSSQVSQLSTASLAEPSMKEFKYQIFQNPVLRYIPTALMAGLFFHDTISMIGSRHSWLFTSSICIVSRRELESVGAARAHRYLLRPVAAQWVV